MAKRLTIASRDCRAGILRRSYGMIMAVAPLINIPTRLCTDQVWFVGSHHVANNSDGPQQAIHIQSKTSY